MIRQKYFNFNLLYKCSRRGQNCRIPERYTIILVLYRLDYKRQSGAQCFAFTLTTTIIPNYIKTDDDWIPRAEK